MKQCVCSKGHSECLLKYVVKYVVKFVVSVKVHGRVCGKGRSEIVSCMHT